MAQQLRVFVSHHHSPEEDRFTARLVADLEAAGADVWVDTAGITSDDFVKKISEGLAGRQWLVLVMMPAALVSGWVQREVNVALSEHTAGRMLGVLPVIMQPCREQDIPMLWRTLHRYDATRDYPPARDGLLRALGLSLPPSAHPATTPSPSPVGARPASPAVSPAPVSPPHTGSPFPPREGGQGVRSDPSILPLRLADLRYTGHSAGGVEYILPPLCTVPAGEFLMGSDPRRDSGAFAAEKPQAKVNLPGFQIAKFPLTVAEYACFVRSGHAEPGRWQRQLGRLDHPVVYVSWNDAVAYAAWLAQLTRQQWRLPSEAEWEKAARGTDGRIYPWGDTFDQSRCNTSEGGRGGTTPVGSYASGTSVYGAQDMAGNVWEWTSSLMKQYPYSPTDGRETQTSFRNRVPRGGSWDSDARGARAAHRIAGHPVQLGNDCGFRVVVAAPGSV